MRVGVEPIQRGEWVQLGQRPISDGTLGRCGPPLPGLSGKGPEGGESILLPEQPHLK
jgi:hypothetical protein